MNNERPDFLNANIALRNITVYTYENSGNQNATENNNYLFTFAEFCLDGF